MRKIKKGFVWMAAMVMILLGCLGVDASDLDDATGMDAVVIIDTSGSMKSTDEHRVALEGAKLFVDMMESTGSRIGLVAFSDVLGNTVGMTQINQNTDKEAVKNAISNLDYKGDTDIGLAAEKAMELLTNAGDVGNKKMILFFTDGKIDLPKTEDPAQANAESKKKAETATSAAAAAGIPIYTIGLNANGALDRELIQQMASSTGGTTYEVTDAGELPDKFNEIFADFVESSIQNIGDVTIQDSNQYENVKFNIPNDSVMEANIVMLSTAMLSDVALVDPEGNTRTVNDTNVSLSISNDYSLLKIYTPKSGDWTLQIKGQQGCQVHVNLLFNYKVILKAAATQNADGMSAKINAYLENKGSALTDAALYAQFTKAVARVSKPDGTTTEYPMTFDGTQFACDIPITPGEDNTITAYAESATMYRESDPISFGIAEAPEEVAVSQMPSPLKVKGLITNMAKAKENLDNYFQSSKGNALSYTVQGADSAIVDVVNNGSSLELKGHKKGTTQMTVTATAPSGATGTQTVDIEVGGVFGNIIPLIGIAIAVLVLLIVLILLLTHKPPKLDGYLFWTVEHPGEFGGEEENDYDLSLENKKVQMSVIVTDTDVVYFPLDKITVIGTKKGSESIQVTGGSAECRLIDQYGAGSKNMIVRAGESFQIACGVEEDEEIMIRCRYAMSLEDDADDYYDGYGDDFDNEY